MKKKLLVGLSIGLLSLTIGFASTSYALYWASARVDQGTGSSGLLKKSIYLCPYIWDVDSPLYVMHAFNSSTEASINLSPSKTVSITVSGIDMDCRVFEFDSVKYDNFVFYRENPETEAIWNQTADIGYNSSKNVYRIIEWDNGYGYNNSGYNDYLY